MAQTSARRRCPGIVDLGLVQSTRGYLPKAVSHYTATWVPKNEFETFQPPTWPLIDAREQIWDKEKLRQELITKWQPIVAQGVPVHVGEWGCLNHTPHARHPRLDAAICWRCGRSRLGLVDVESPGQFWHRRQRPSDVQYEDFHGHKLDRQMLELLLAG